MSTKITIHEATWARCKRHGKVPFVFGYPRAMVTRKRQWCQCVADMHPAMADAAFSFILALADGLTPAEAFASIDWEAVAKEEERSRLARGRELAGRRCLTDPTPLTLIELKTLWHSLGMKTENYRRSDEWWLDDDKHRNHYATKPSGRQARDKEINTLEARGFMKRGRDIPGGLVYYHVTPEGILAAKAAFAAKRKKEKTAP